MVTTASAKPARWTSRQFEPEDLTQVIDLLQVAMGPNSQGADSLVWQWKHLQSPFGRSYLQLGIDGDGEVIGLRAFSRWRLDTAGGPIEAVRAVDTATSPKMRRAGVFSGLTKQVVTQAREDGVSLVFNTPNESSMAGYLKMGWQHVGSIRPMIHVPNFPVFAAKAAWHRLSKSKAPECRPEEFLARPLPLVGEYLDQEADGVNRLLAAATSLRAGTNEFAIARTWEYLQWRYAKHPYIRYYAVPYEVNGDLAGLAIFRPNIRFGLKEIVLCELLLSEANQGVCSELIRTVRRSVKADHIVAYFGEASLRRKALARNGFRTIPKAHMNFTANVLNPIPGMDPFNLQNWALTLGDLELF